MTQELDVKLKQLKQLEDTIKKMSDEKETLRKEVFETLEKENLGQYKSDVATVSQVERKTIRFSLPQEDVLKHLEENKLVKYFTIIPEHKEINKQFEKDIKESKFSLEGVSVEVKKLPMIRFN